MVSYIFIECYHLQSQGQDFCLRSLPLQKDLVRTPHHNSKCKTVFYSAEGAYHHTIINPKLTLNYRYVHRTVNTVYRTVFPVELHNKNQRTAHCKPVHCTLHTAN